VQAGSVPGIESLGVGADPPPFQDGGEPRRRLVQSGLCALVPTISTATGLMRLDQQPVSPL